MKSKEKVLLVSGTLLIVGFIIWTMLIQIIDVQNVGVNSTAVGFATFNTWFHTATGVNMRLYNITDWLGLVPLLVCAGFGVVGLFQLIKRKSLLKVDFDIIVLGVYYVIVILCYMLFEIVPINYRPVLINGFMEASYPSSTTLLVLCVMPTLVFQLNRRLKSPTVKHILTVLSAAFSAFMVIGRLISGVHWFTDIIGSVLFSTGLFLIYKSLIFLKAERKNKVYGF
ncbi:MAG: phosphatase PAP2 family protein [Clostridia bacterium]|nr:phosphatase PAP2 family protein [Clostridia bacterium]